MSRSGVRPSPIRVMVVRELANAGRPLSSLEIENLLDTVDHSSISRTISILMAHNMLHQISDGTGSMKYELCADGHADTHSDQHVHFHCRQCGITECFQYVPVPRVALPDGYTAESTSYIVTGVCAKCKYLF